MRLRGVKFLVVCGFGFARSRRRLASCVWRVDCRNRKSRAGNRRLPRCRGGAASRGPLFRPSPLIPYFQDLSSRACEGPDCPSRQPVPLTLRLVIPSLRGTLLFKRPARIFAAFPSSCGSEQPSLFQRLALTIDLSSDDMRRSRIEMQQPRGRPRPPRLSPEHPALAPCLSTLPPKLVILSAARNERSRRTTVTSDTLMVVVLRLRSFA